MTDKAWEQRRRDFLANCYLLLDRIGVEKDYVMVPSTTASPGIEYEDEVIRISKDAKSKVMEVEKKENRNPVIFTDEDGKAYRFHGEYIDLEDHLNALIAGLEESG
jgi:hypothetical protein